MFEFAHFRVAVGIPLNPLTSNIHRELTGLSIHTPNTGQSWRQHCQRTRYTFANNREVSGCFLLHSC